MLLKDTAFFTFVISIYILFLVWMLTGSNPPGGMLLKPIIGISIDNGDSPGVEASKLGMIEAVEKVGGIPLLLNDRGDRDPAKDIKQIDALIVQGDSFDVDPAQYGQIKHKETHIETDKTRTVYEDRIIAKALSNKVPILLICGGMQRANVLLGGTLHQHIPDLPGVKPGHGNNAGKPPEVPSVTAVLLPDSNLAKILGKIGQHAPVIMINSYHHQSLDRIGRGLHVVAYSDEYTRADGNKDHLVEAVETDPKGQYAGQFILGLQFHPEMMPGNPTSLDIFHATIRAAAQFASDTHRTHTDETILRKISYSW